MSEQPSPEPEKTRRTRSFGSFLLFLLVLIAILLVVGGDSMGSPDELTQDQFEYYLHTGQIESLRPTGSDKGTNLVEGTYRRGGEEVKFKVRYSSVEEREQQFKDLKAIGHYQTITPEALLAGMRAGIWEPIEARSLTGFRSTRTGLTQPGTPPDADRPADDEAEDEGTPRVRQTGQRSPQWEERLMVSALAKVKPAEEHAHHLQGVPASVRPKKPGHVFFDVHIQPDDDLTGLLATVEGAGASIEHLRFDLTDELGTAWKKDSTLLTNFLIYYGPWILIFVVFLIFMRQMRAQGGAGGVMSFGRSRAQLYSKENHTNVTFDDVAGADEAKSEVREIVEFLKNPSRFTRIGGRIPRGVLLVGSPGCGKTLLAKAIAGEAEVPFFSISGSDFVEMFVGVGASRVRDLFKQARENSPCIIFLDEIDAVGRRRGSGMGGGHDEREQTLNAILVEMDGFGTDEGIIVVAATNRPDVLDPALLRPGRFDREVTIDLPDLEGRKMIIEVHLKRVKVGDDVDSESLARSSPGYSGADLAAIVNEAAIMAVLDKRDEISMADLEEARDKVRYGRQKRSRKIEEQDRKITAYHEAGHAVVAAVIPETDHPHKVTIVPRGRALGATMILPDKESYHMQKGRMLAQLAMLFGGRVAEEEFCGDISAGASDDISRATDLARAMVTELGMSEKIGPINYAERQGSDFLGTELMRAKQHSEETAREIDQEIRIVLRAAYERAQEIIQGHRAAIEEMAVALLELETLSGTEVQSLLDGASSATLVAKREAKAPKAAPPSPPPVTPEEKRQPEEDGGHAGGLLGPSPA